MTCMVTLLIRHEAKASQRSTFERISSRVCDKILREANLLAQQLHGARGLFAASEEVTRTEFRKFDKSFARETNSSSTQGHGFLRYVPVEEAEKFTAAGGLPEFSISPGGAREAMMVIEYIKPFERHASLLGRDLGADATRRQAAIAAMFENQATGTAIIPLKNDPQQSAENPPARACCWPSII